tara:strand:- start:25599 stop:26051 length:453 start_codon:yes stop_codon:yes gene_type:complete
MSSGGDIRRFISRHNHNRSIAMSNKAVINTEKAPAAIGPYSQAIKAGNTVYISGQIPLDPATMELVSDDFETQARQVFKNLSAVCEEAAGSLQDIVKINLYLVDLDNFAIVNRVMEEFFATPYPARAAVGIKALPKGSQFEAEAVMVIGD